MCGLTTIGEAIVYSNVCPFGAALATSCTPMMELAPGLLSTTTGTPSAADSSGATSRAWKSACPPGGNGTTIRTGLPGTGNDCAMHGREAAAIALRASVASIRRRECIVDSREFRQSLRGDSHQLLRRVGPVLSRQLVEMPSGPI